MANYKYDALLEVFKRVDNRGNYLAVNISEAQRIINLLDLGYSHSAISNKVRLSNQKAGMSTVKSFIKNYLEGNIEIPEDAPAPVNVFTELDESNRLDALERRLCELEEEFEEYKASQEDNWISRIRSRI